MLWGKAVPDIDDRELETSAEDTECVVVRLDAVERIPYGLRLYQVEVRRRL